MHDGDRLGDVRQIKRFLDGRVSAADHDHILVAIEEAVAGSAGRYAKALEMLFAFNAQPFCLCAGRNDDRVRSPDCSGIGFDGEGASGRLDFGHEVVDDLCAHMGCLLEHLLHQPGALDGIAESRIVLYIRGDHQLAALFHAGDQDRLQHGTCCIDGCGVSGGA
ncbi:hypothetical protein D3C80_368210 [compost metagenome]